MELEERGGGIITIITEGRTSWDIKEKGAEKGSKMRGNRRERDAVTITTCHCETKVLQSRTLTTYNYL